MAKIVAGVGISHAPGALGWPEAPPEPTRRTVEKAAKDLGEYLENSQADVLVAFLDDHFENHFRSLMPTVALGVAEQHIGPARQWLAALQLTEQEKFAGAPQVAEALIRSIVGQGFDVARMGAIEFGNNLLVPWKIMGLKRPIAVIPVFFNVFSPPVMSYTRALALGRALRVAVQRDLDPTLRVAFMATGGLSHWPPFWNDSSAPEDEFLQGRMKRFQSEGRDYLATDPNLYTDLAAYEIRMAAEQTRQGRPLVNAEWDREFLTALSKGDESYVSGLTFEGVERDGGHGGHEILMWIALMGAMDCRPARVLAYEAVPEWICGMAYVSYPQ